MYRVSALSPFDLNSQSLDILLDSAASVHVFNIKKKISNFKRALKGQGLLFGGNIISIERWRQISLPLKVKGRIKLLTLNNVANIFDFPLKLVPLGCLQNGGFDWSHRSSKILKNNQIIGYTRFYGNYYKIGNDKNGELIFATFASDPATAKNSQPYQKTYSASISDSWHCRMRNIDLLGLHMLGKHCLAVQSHAKKMSK